MYFLVYILLEMRGEHSSKECCTTPPDIDVGNSDNPDFQGSAYSRSNSSFLIEDILFQRPKVNVENSNRRKISMAIHFITCTKKIASISF